ncbi:Rv3654c family TadE-like protein [Zhihengliuella salsuginis]|uniref:Putative Flp pilus-assembly TadG-like N-terminal domain-containing protein n=1 Tax=Zhihengliuella salsuginis TaxID=578222 RepID=A0ABQ3GG34_9MICC|nr:Rv3654c family TadE-like protein [Zhihengliuella salsuginis]GHD02933.1 hypothetical protein GCM10008096_08620 [Zhihengliuella salsuginis]
MPAENGPLDGARGAGTVLMVGLAAAVLLAGAAVLTIGQAAVAATRATTAADLAALAAADTARGVTDGETCAVAARVAGRNGARVTSCALGNPEGTVVDVSVAVRLGEGIGVLEGVGLEARATARAGPPPAPWAELPG